MPSLNKVFLMGNLTRDPEMRVTPKGTAITNFDLAINRTVKTADGGTKEEVTFVSCDSWGKTAETIAKWFSKGKPIFVEGRLRLDQWEDKNTKEKRSRLKVVVDQFQFVGGNKGEGEAAPASNEAAKPAARSGSGKTPPPVEDLDEDVPF